ncbi:DNA ligase D [Alsobacter sp. R-9]
MGALDTYRAKRDFRRTKEPRGRAGAPEEKTLPGGRFVVHKHAARRLHYDLRLEHGGVLWSWAVTRGPSLDPHEKRLAVHVEDHPLNYAGFEGTIPAGEYGAGAVIVWDEGQWVPEGDPEAGLAKGHLSFALKGHKLAGGWHLVRLKPRRGEKGDNWLLIKADDEVARVEGDILEEAPESVSSGRRVEDFEAGVPAAPAKPRAARVDRSRKVAAPQGSAPKAPPRKKPAARTDDAPMPDFVEPCLATLRTSPPAGHEWLHEVKFDGYRLQAHVDHGNVRLLTRSGLDWTQKFGTGVRDALAALPCTTAILDGELVVPDATGVSSFSARQAALSEGCTDDLVLFLFDLLYLDGRDRRGEPLLTRRSALEDLLARSDAHPAVRFSEHFDDDGAVVLAHSCRMGLEGVVSKRTDAPYRSGRGHDWIKSKCTQRQEFAIAGYIPSAARGRGIASLVLAVREAGVLAPVGNVGTGFSAKTATDLQRRLDRLRTEASPFAGKGGRQKGVVWVRPELVAEVEFRAWTASGSIRHASFLGLREDKPAREVSVERPEDDPKPDPVQSRRARRAGAGDKAGRKAAGAVTSVRLTNAGKVLWPAPGLTKKDLLDYYATVWPLMRDHVCRRPLSLVRAPDGIGGPRFFQKHAMPGMPAGVRRVADPKDGEDLLYIEDFDGLAGLVQMGVLEVHVWGATIDALEQPDQIVFDLDPDPGVSLAQVRVATTELRARLEALGLPSVVKLSGGKGYHVVVPLKPAADWAAVKGFAHDFARAMEQAAPDRYTATLSKKARKGRIFIDYLRNGRGSTAVAPWSTRARDGAPVSAPIPWTDVPRLGPADLAVPAILKGDIPPDAWKGWRNKAGPLVYTPR